MSPMWPDREPRDPKYVVPEAHHPQVGRICLAETEFGGVIRSDWGENKDGHTSADTASSIKQVCPQRTSLVSACCIKNQLVLKCAAGFTKLSSNKEELQRTAECVAPN